MSGVPVVTKKRLSAGRLLVVEDDDVFFRTLERIVSRHRPLRHARTFESAEHELESRNDWCGFIFDVNLGDHPRGGLELLELASQRFPGLPTLVMTGFLEAATVNRATSLGSYVLVKPAGETELMPFLQRVIARELGLAKDFSEKLDALSRAWRLSPREHEILAWFVAGNSREDFVAFTGLAETTLKTHLKHLFEKTGYDSVADVVGVALRALALAPPKSSSGLRGAVKPRE